MQDLNKKGHTIIMASHLLDEVEKVCTHVAILQKGTLITTGNVDDVLVDEDIVEISAASLDALLTLMKSWGAAQSVTLKDKSARLPHLHQRHRKTGRH